MAGSGFPVWLMAALLALVTIALYWPVMRHGFVNYDDNVRHFQCSRPKRTDPGGHQMGLLQSCGGNWHPVTMLSHMLDCQLFGLKPWGHHLTSVLLHALNTALVFLLLRSLTGRSGGALLVAALFGCTRCMWNRWPGWRNARMC
jgi:hypothetical protein